MRRFESVFTNRISSSWHQKSKLSKRIILICSTFFILITQVPLWQTKWDLLQNIQHSSVVITMDSKSEGRQIETRGEPMTLFSCGEPIALVFLGDANVMFCPKNHEPNFCYNITISLEVESPTFVSPEAPLQYWCVGVLQLSWFFVKIEATDNRSNFAETILFENGSCFSKIPYSISVESPRIFQCLISISAGHWVWQIDGHLPRRTFLSALLSLVISMTGRSKRSAKALRHGADVVRGYRKLILRADLLYDDDDCFYYHSWRNNVVIAFGTLSSFHNIKI